MTDDASALQRAKGSYIAQAKDNSTATVQVFPSPEPPQEQNRVRFLKRLRYLYGELWEQSLQGSALVTLELVKKPDAILHHTSLLFHSRQQPERLLPPDTSIVEVYDKSGGELLILGEPGTGKSTLLLDLARQLVELAEKDTGKPLPVIFPLSSWAIKRSPLLQDWLVEQLTQLYDVPRILSRKWVEEERIFPLLDGLDEMESTARPECIVAINAYHRDHLVPLVVCSRKTEFDAVTQQQHLALQSAVVVQPLTREQVDNYLVQAGQSLATALAVLRANPGLQELTTTPLMLNILALTYTGAREEDLPQQGSVEEQQQQALASYVERVVESKGNIMRYPLQSTRAWLGWLARQMQKHNRAVFYLEYLQLDWLAPGQFSAYAWLAVRLPGILIGVLASLCITLLFSLTDVPFMILYGVLGGLLGGLSSGASLERVLLSRQMESQGRGLSISGRIAMSVIIGLIVGLGFGLDLGIFKTDLVRNYRPGDWLRDGCIYGVVIGLSSLLLQFMPQVASQDTLPSGNSTKQRWMRFVRRQAVHGQRALLVAAGVGLSTGLSYGLAYGLVSTWSYGLIYGLSHGLSAGLSAGLIYGLISVLVSLVLKVQAGGIHLTEHLTWTWGSLMRSLLTARHAMETLLLAGAIFMSVGLSVGLNMGLSGGRDPGLIYGLSDGLSVGLSVGLSYWILSGLFQGISSEQIKDQFRLVPNQGVRRSFRNGVLMGIISGAAIWVMGAVSDGLGYGLRFGLFAELSAGWSVGWSAGLRYVLSHGLSHGLSIGLSEGWRIGVCSGLLVCAAIGGLAALRHVVLRFLLWRSHTFPWNAPQFLDDATARILLRRVGGGYSFVHRLILDYFASLDTMPTESVVSSLAQAVPSRVCACGHLEERPEARFCPRCGRPLRPL